MANERLLPDLKSRLTIDDKDLDRVSKKATEATTRLDADFTGAGKASDKLTASLTGVNESLTATDESVAATAASLERLNAVEAKTVGTTEASADAAAAQLGVQREVASAYGTTAASADALTASLEGTNAGAEAANAALAITDRSLAATAASSDATMASVSGLNAAMSTSTEVGSAQAAVQAQVATGYAATAGSVKGLTGALEATNAGADAATVALQTTDRSLDATTASAEATTAAMTGVNKAMVASTGAAAAQTAATTASTAAQVDAGTVLNNTSTAASALANAETKAARVRREATVVTRSFAQTLGDTSKELGGLGAAGSSAATKLGTLDKVIGPGGTLPIGMTAVVAGLAAAYIGIKTLSSSVGDYLHLADAIDTYVAITGESVEVASRQISAFARLGVPTEDATASMSKLTLVIQKNSDALSAHGVEVAHDANGNIDLNATLLNVLDAWNATGDAVTRDQIAFAAFGKNFQSLLPVLQAGSAALKEFEAQASLVLTQKDLDQARKYELQTQQLSQRFSDWKDNMGRLVVPAISAVIDKSNENRYVIDKLKEAGMNEIQAELASMRTRDQQVLALRRQYQATEAARFKEDQLAQQLRESAKAAEAERQKIEALTMAEESNADATIAVERAQLGLQHAAESLSNAQQDVAQAQKDLTAAVRAHGPRSQEAKDATNQLAQAQLALTDAIAGEKDSLISLAKAQVEQAAKQAEVNGQTLSAKQKHDLLISSLQQEAAALAPNSPLRLQLKAYIDLLQQVPENVQTIIGYRFKDASGHTSGIVARQHGGEVVPNRVYTVGESGTELLTMGEHGGFVTPLGERMPGGSDESMAAVARLLEQGNGLMLAAIEHLAELSGRPALSASAAVRRGKAA